MNQKIIFITGASSGIGQACARRFAKLGAKLILCARRVDQLKQLENELKHAFNTDLIHIELDVRDKSAVFNAIAALPTAWKNIQVLINSAGLAAGLDKLQEANLDDWEAMIDTNIKGLLYITRAILPLMIENNQGHIVNIGSLAGHQTYVGGSVYSATKYAVKALSESIKLDLTGYAIRVTSIDPGLVETQFSQVRFKGDMARAKNVYAGMTPLTPEDIADAIHYAVNAPAHVNISEMIILPTDQSSATVVARRSELTE